MKGRMSKNMKRKRNRRRKKYPILEIGIFLVLVLLIVILFLTQQINKEKEEALAASETQTEENTEEEKEPEKVDLSGLYSTSAILIDLDTGEVLTQRNPVRSFIGFSYKDDDGNGGSGKYSGYQRFRNFK